MAALGLLLQTLLQERLREAKVDLSAEQAQQAMETVRYVRFHVNGETRTGVSTANPRVRQVMKALGINAVRSPKLRIMNGQLRSDQ